MLFFINTFNWPQFMKYVVFKKYCLDLCCMESRPLKTLIEYPDLIHSYKPTWGPSGADFRFRLFEKDA